MRLRTYAISDAEVKPYFALERMVAAAFDCAERLFGVRFIRREGLALYHPDVNAYEVRRRDDGDGHARRPLGRPRVAEEVEQLITVPLEADLLNGVAFLDEIRSESIPGLSSIEMIFACA